MNAKVQELIDLKIAEAKAKKEEAKRKHLVELGLIEGVERVYSDTYTYGADTKYDEERKQYYVEVPQAIEVSDEEYAEICRYYPESKGAAVAENDDEYAAENTLKTIATLCLVVGAIAAVFCLMIVIEEELDASVLIGVAVAFLAILEAWALLRCIGNMSTTLKQIKAKLK